MWRTVSLALRNLGRNLRRTLLTLSAIAFGLAMMILVVVIQAGQHDDMRRSAIRSMAGNVVVEPAKPRKEREPEDVVPHASAVAAALQAASPGGTVTTRIWLEGLATSANGAAGIGLQALDPVAEVAAQDITARLHEGEWLAPDDAKGIVLGEGVAETLQVKVGDKVVFMGQFGGEEVESRLFRVRGLWRSGAPEVDGVVAFVTVRAGQDLLGQADVAHQVAVHMAKGQDEGAVYAAAEGPVRAAVGDAPVAVLHWRDAMPELFTMIELDAVSNDVMLAILGVIVAMGVLNTVLMSVLERTREFGVLMAIGLRPRRLATMVLLEALFLGVIGTALGFAAGLALAWPIVRDGIDYSGMLGEAYSTGGIVLSTKIKGYYDWGRLSQYAVGGVALTVLAAVWPAFTVTRLTPVEAMHKT